MSSEELINYYGIDSIIPSDSTLFKFVLEEDGVNISVFLADEINALNITELVIPYECEFGIVTKIGNEAFFKCENLEKVIIPNSIWSIGELAFAECKNITNLIIPYRVMSIGARAFKDCSQMEWIRLSNNLGILETETFWGCEALKVIVIPSSVQKINSKCFFACNNLKKIIVERENLIIETELDTFPTANENFKIYCNPIGTFKDNQILQPYIFIWSKYDEFYYYCNGKIDRLIFYDCNMINKTAIIFNSLLKNNGVLKEIDEDAFTGCFEIEVLEINKDIVIKSSTFIDCVNLTDVFINSSNVEVEKNAFPLTNTNFTIYNSSHSTLVKNVELQPYMFLFKETTTSHNSHLFIAGVGEVELFKGKDIVLTSKTLIDTGINLTVNLEDIQANGGAKLYGKYASQAGMTVRLTDAMFRMEFLAANLGEDVELGGSAITMEHSIVQNGIAKINGEPLPLYIGSEDVMVWLGEQKGNTKFLSFSNENIKQGKGEDFGKTLITGIPFPDGTQICVKYIKEHEEGQTIKVSANYLPDEMTAILTASLFAGDQNNLEMATRIGTLTITIPRLILNGNSEISMNMTGSSQMNIEGQALAVEASECDEGGYYAIISKIIKNTTWTANLGGLAIDNANHLKSGDFLNVYGVFYGMGTRPLTSDQYVVLPSNYVDKRGYINYNGKDELLLTVILKDDSNKITRGIVEGN